MGKIMTASVKSPREHYLDNLRWIAMLLGVLVHASTLGAFGLIDNVTTISSMFRMALFFMISGYLGAMLLQRKKVSEFLIGRMRNLLIPLIAATVLLNPITIWLMFQYLDGSPSWPRVLSVFSGTDPELGVHIVWHMHLWFLLSLIFFVLLGSLLRHSISNFSNLVEEKLFNSRTSIKLIPTLVLVFGVFVSLTLMAFLRIIQNFIGEVPWLVRVTFQYVPFYLIGMLLFNSPKLLERVREADYILGGVILSAYFLARYGSEFVSCGGVFVMVSLIAVRIWVCFFFLGLGFRFLNMENRFTSLMSRSIYTIYIFHFLILYGVATAVSPLFEITPVTYWVVVILTLAFSLLLHVFLIERSPFLSFVFNGRKLSNKEIRIRA